MDNMHLSRRDFIKNGLMVAGAGIMGVETSFGPNCPEEKLDAPGPIPLNNILTDYQQINPKFGFGLNKASVCDKVTWQRKKENIKKRSRLILGQSPDVKEEISNKSKVSSEIQRDGYRELKVQFPTGLGDTNKGYLLIPDNVSSSSPQPGIMALHFTGPGSRQAVGLIPQKRGAGKDLAQRGYVVLAIDVISAGERIYDGYNAYYTEEFYNKYPQWSAMGKMLFDHQRGVDYLCSLDIVDAERLGCIGHSLGGYNSFFLHAFDPRIKAGVSSCGLSPMGGTNTPYQFARDDWFVHFNPMCREYIRAGMIPCDMHEVMALGAPRPFFNYSAKNDTIYFPPSVHDDDGFSDWWKTVDAALKQIEKVYEILGASDNFVRRESDGDHDFPSSLREEAYSWLDKQLDMK